MNIKLICVGSIKEKYYRDAIAEFQKRLKSYVKLTIIELKDEPIKDNPSEADIDIVLTKESALILKNISERDYVYTLCIDGTDYDSVAFSKKIDRDMTSGISDICFIIGSSHGLHQSVIERANQKISFSKMTFPHQLMRIFLLEQIYRAFKIMRGEPYHK